MKIATVAVTRKSEARTLQAWVSTLKSSRDCARPELSYPLFQRQTSVQLADVRFWKGWSSVSEQKIKFHLSTKY